MAHFAPTTFLPRDNAPAAERAPRRGLLRRFYDGIVEAREREAERVVAQYLASTGGKLTDSLEREIERRLFPAERTLGDR